MQAASKCKQIPPGDPQFMALLGPTQQALMKVTSIKEDNRPSKQFNHLSEVAEGIPALAWVTLVSEGLLATHTCVLPEQHNLI